MVISPHVGVFWPDRTAAQIRPDTTSTTDLSGVRQRNVFCGAQLTPPHGYDAGSQTGGVSTVADVLVILVVEDELLIQDLLKDTLHDGGYEVAIASSGEEAIRLLDTQNPKYRALVTDINLGRGQVDGWDVAKHARELEHDLPVVYMTGDSAGDWASRGVPNSVLITKPYAPAQILTAVSQLLNTSSTQVG